MTSDNGRERVCRPGDAVSIAQADAVGLVHTSDCMPGIRRIRAGDGFSYRRDDGEPLSAEVLERIRSLTVPPAWTDVWICADPEGHLQATGRDKRGRKQYRYHPRWREVRDETKYDRMLAFGETLPRLRERVAEDLRRRGGLSRERVLATLVALLDETLVRVGNPEYRDANCSFGLTTLRDEHVAVSGSRVRLRFRGKAGKESSLSVEDARLARIVKRLRDLPGQEVFQYAERDGTQRIVGSGDVNAYLAEIAGEEFSSKDFRTWGGTVAVAGFLAALPAPSTRRQAERNVVEAVREAASHLGNTPAVCRRSYVHPRVIDAYLDGSLTEGWDPQSAEGPDGSRAEERLVLGLLRRREPS